MGEYASKGVAGTGLGLGIAGTALGVLAGSNNGNGLLGGLFGGGANNAVVAENAQLKAERYADKVGIETYKQTRIENTDLGDRILGNWIKPLAQESAANRERLATLEAKVDGNKAIQDKENELIRKEIEISNLRLNNKIDVVALTAKNGIDQLSAAVANINETIGGWKCNKVSATSICPPVMERYNQWEAPTNAAPATQPVTGTINVV